MEGASPASGSLFSLHTLWRGSSATVFMIRNEMTTFTQGPFPGLASLHDYVSSTVVLQCGVLELLVNMGGKLVSRLQVKGCTGMT